MEKVGDKTKQEAVVYNIHHLNEGDELYKREIIINGSMYSVALTSHDPKESIDYLTEKCLFILKELNKEGK